MVQKGIILLQLFVAAKLLTTDVSLPTPQFLVNFVGKMLTFP